MKATSGYYRVHLGTIVASLFITVLGCSRTTELTAVEREKLDPQLIMLLRGDAIADSDLDVGIRKDGSKEYGIIIRSKNAEEIRKAGIQIGSTFSDVITARVTIPELKRVLSLESVRAVQASSKNHPQ
ncbi:MAG: hypothetical protein NTU47_08995 [Ignavibacteriales bacterium]|nr:hypothetical protein [Ignavibacteriales bacterium]